METATPLPDQIIRNFLTLPRDEQLLVLRTLLPQALVGLDAARVVGILRDLLGEASVALKGNARSGVLRPSRRTRVHAQRRDLKTRAILREMAAATERTEEILVDAFRGVMCTLGHRITGREKEHLLAQLPHGLQALAQCAKHADTYPLRPRDIDVQEFVDLVADHLPTDARSEVQRLIRAVMKSVHDHVSQGEADDVASQLPRSLRALWMNA